MHFIIFHITESDTCNNQAFEKQKQNHEVMGDLVDGMISLVEFIDFDKVARLTDKLQKVVLELLQCIQSTSSFVCKSMESSSGESLNIVMCNTSCSNQNAAAPLLMGSYAREVEGFWKRFIQLKEEYLMCIGTEILVKLTEQGSTLSLYRLLILT